MSDQFSSESMMDMFVFETSQLIEQLEESILSNEKTSCYSESAINEIFRIMHTIKGSSAMMTFDNMSSLAHAMEDLFYYIREEKPQNVDYSILTDLILECIDFIKVEIEKIKNNDAPDGEYSALIDRIKDFLAMLKDGSTLITTADVNKDNDNLEQHIYCSETGLKINDKNFMKAGIHFENGCEMENIRAYAIIHHIKSIVDEVFYIPDDIIENDETIELIRKEGFQIYIKTNRSYEEISNFFMSTAFLRDIELIQLENDNELKQLFGEKSLLLKGTEEKLPNSKKVLLKQNGNQTNPKEVQLSSSQQSMISVSVLKLDKLMDLVGEMVIAEAMVIQNSDLNGLVLDNFNKASRQLNKITDEIQDMVMAIRMVPLSATFHKLHRIVRDMCKKLGKEVDLEIIGEETEVDKNIIEHISDPLMHLVRNALDHGIETPDERTSLGKPSLGTITLEAKNAGSDVLILIKDNGKGLDRAKILKKAKDNNLLTKPEEEMLDREIFNLIFLPGFSTNDNVTEFSGRGVGMDVVTKNIEAVGGSVSVESIMNQGSVITLKIPLTLAIIDGMNIKVGSSHYTIPTVSIKEFFRPKINDIITDPDGNEMIMVRGQCYTILRLYEFYKVKNAKTEFEDGIIIMVEQDSKTLCIFADELLGQQQVVVKALPEYIRRLKKIKGLTGCTLLGDGNISLILDIAGLMH